MEKNIIFEKGGGAKISYFGQIYTPLMQDEPAKVDEEHHGLQGIVDSCHKLADKAGFIYIYIFIFFKLTMNDHVVVCGLGDVDFLSLYFNFSL